MLQKASDKFRVFLEKRVHFGVSRSQTSMARQSSKVEAIYELCKKTFSPSGSPPPSAEAVSKLSSLLDAIHPADVGLKEENPDDDRGLGFFRDNLNRVSRWTQPITYLNLYEGDSFTMCIFCFPTSSVIPLHDHPGMTVFSKVLYGSLHVRAYDWVEPSQESKGSNYFPVRLAKLAADKVVTAPCGTSVLYPKRGGNLHSFTAVTPCAVLDILTPPYREDLGRKCTYYRDYPYTAFPTEIKVEEEKEEEYAWLGETEPNIYMREGNYTGPIIQI
ncbi:plant cysteine oxidase 3 [Rosa rugosa]|uniref:plant cysteine oxidase 3 n=1 Tax=Rosa rugosa TaxID=74645 RepID=UPI002B4084F6|nr:plant cysteine oxidase 3 [Rosa rugosa]